MAVGREEELGGRGCAERAPLTSRTCFPTEHSGARAVSAWSGRFGPRGHAASTVHTWRDCSVSLPTVPDPVGLSGLFAWRATDVRTDV